MVEGKGGFCFIMSMMVMFVSVVKQAKKELADG